MPHPPVSPDQAWIDLQPVIDAELARLPEKYRIPVVLCDLNGRPQRDVARELKLPPATLANRLAAARRLLAKRLTQRGVALSGGAIAAALNWHAATSAVSPTLLHGTVKAACAAAVGNATGLPGPVVELSEGVMRMFVVSKLRAAVAGAATGLLLLAGLGLMAGPSLRANPDEKPKAAAPAARADPEGELRAAESDDATYLRRTSLDLRGTLPTGIELRYFLADTDAKKRGKVLNWMLAEHGAQKVSARCQKCHTAPFPLPADADGWQALLLGERFRELHGHGDVHAQITGWFFNSASRQAEAPPEVQQARAAVEAAKQEVKIKQLALLQLRNLVESKAPGRRPADVTAAEMELQKAHAQQKAAEAKLASLGTVLHRAVWKARGEPGTDADRTARRLDELIKEYYSALQAKREPSDVEFLRRLLLDVRGTPPTKVEENYFQADKDPKKRERLLEWLLAAVRRAPGYDKFVQDLLADPEVQKRWTALWQERLLADQKAARDPHRARWLDAESGDRLDRLLSELLAGGKPDEQVLDALCLATLARFPTETERRLILDGLKGQSDRAGAWRTVLRALATTQEARAHAEGLSKRGAR